MPRLYTRTGSPYWQAEIQVKGEPKRISTGVPASARTRKRAEEAANNEENRLNQSESLTFTQAAALYLDKATLRESTKRVYRIRIQHINQARPGVRLADILPNWVRTYMRDRRASQTDVGVLGELFVLSSVIEYAIENGFEGAPEINPVRVVSKKSLAKSPRIERWLTPKQVDALIAAAPNAFWRRFIFLSVETGMRLRELLHLRWEEVNLELGIVTLPADRVKTGKGRVVPLTNTARSTLLSIERHPTSPYVFSSRRTGEVRTAAHVTWDKIRRAAGVPNARIHDLRHTFASLTRQSGLARDDRKSIMGHTTEGAHDIYSHTEIALLREQINKHAPSTMLAQCV